MKPLIGFFAALAITAFLLFEGHNLFERTEEPSSAATPPATLTGQQLTTATGTIQVVHLIPAPADPAAFTLGIDAPSGTVGPGPSQAATSLPLGNHTVSVVPNPEAKLPGAVSLLDVSCQSDRHVTIPVQPARAIVVPLTQPGETVTCIFQSSITPPPPSSPVTATTPPPNN